MNEMIHDARVIPLTGQSHAPDAVRQLHGDSRGRWDGDTLVVETTNYSSDATFRGSSNGLHMVERFTLVGPRTLLIPLMRSDEPMFMPVTRVWTAS